MDPRNPNVQADDDSRFRALSDDDKARYVAQCLGCATDNEARLGWPIGLIANLISLRMNRDPSAYYLALGKTLSPDIH